MNILCNRHMNMALILLLVFAIGGCEAPLDMSAVDGMKKKPLRRTDFYQAISVQGSNVVLVGRDGVLLSSNDHAHTWSRHHFDGFPSFIDITKCPNGSFAALDTTTGVWIGDKKGANWHKNNINTKETVQAITCDPDNKLWVVGSYSNIFNSDDMGKNWSNFSFKDDAILTGIQFLDDKHGVVVGEFGTFITTSDGGKKWSKGPPIPKEFYPEDMYFIDPNDGWVIGLGGTVLYTKDSGVSWQHQKTDTKLTLYGITVVDGNPYIAGREGILLKLQGDQWIKIKHDNHTRPNLRAISPIGKGGLIIGGEAGALMLLDEKLQEVENNDSSIPGA